MIAMFHSQCCGQHTHTRRCRSWFRWVSWSTLLARTQMACIDCLEFLATVCRSYTAMHFTSDVRSAAQSTCGHLLHVLAVSRSPRFSVCTVTAVILQDASANARWACRLSASFSFSSLAYYDYTVRCIFDLTVLLCGITLILFLLVTKVMWNFKNIADFQNWYKAVEVGLPSTSSLLTVERWCRRYGDAEVVQLAPLRWILVSLPNLNALATVWDSKILLRQNPHVLN